MANPRFWDEIHSAAGMATIKAVKNHDPSRGCKIEAFVRSCVRWAVMRELRLAPPVATMGQKGIEATEKEQECEVLAIQPEMPVGTDVEQADNVRNLLKVLPARHAALLKLVYVDDVSQREAGRRLGLSEPSVNRLRNEAEAWIRKRAPQCEPEASDEARSC